MLTFEWYGLTRHFYGQKAVQQIRAATSSLLGCGRQLLSFNGVFAETKRQQPYSSVLCLALDYNPSSLSPLGAVSSGTF